jgi:hypothetical protein
MPKLIEKINQDLAKNNLEIRTREARSWLYNHLKSMRVNRMALIKDKSNNFVRKMMPGRMYLYGYYPKGYETLPYYDLFPVVIPLKKYSDGVLGMNLHYLPPKPRIIFLDKLYSYLNNDKYDETTKLRLTYSLMDNASKYKLFRPCLKRYLYGYLESRIIEIPINDWEIVCYLPVEKFVGSTAAKVQKESITSVIRGKQEDE